MRTLLISLCLLVPAALPAYQAKTLSPEQASADVALARQALELIHPGLYRYTPKAEMDAAFAALEQRVKQPISDVELYGEMSLLLAKIHCDHTKAELPGAISKYRKENPTHLPFRFRLFDGKMYVASSPQLEKGTEILSINGVPVSEILARIGPAVSYDGLTESVIPWKLEADSDLMGSDFDQFYPVFFGFSDKLEVEIPGRTVTLKPVTYSQWQSLPWPSADGGEFHKATTWKRIDPRTAYLRIDTFVNYRNPVDPAAVYDPIFQAIQDAEHLVIDLRANGGGSTDASEGLARYLLEKPFVMTKSVRLKAIRYGDLPRHIESWGDRKALFEPPVESFRKLDDGYEEIRETEPTAPSPYRFKGKVTVLTGPGNGSGSTMLIAKLKDEGRVRLVGLPTGGSAEGPTGGQIFFVKLPASGITVRVPTKRSFTNISNFQPGRGVSPDVEVKPTLADFLADRDPALGVALGLTTDAARLDRPSNAERLEALTALLRERGLEFEVQPFENERKEKGQNVIVTLGSGERDIVIGAHFDAVRLKDGSLSHGMVDNAAGTVVLTRVAEALRARRLKHKIRVVFFDMEELGLLGSAHYVKSLETGKVAAAVNVDIAGYGDTLIFGPAKGAGNAEVYGAMWRTCAEQRFSCLEFPNFPQGDDRSFQAAKIPNLSLAIVPALEAHQLWLMLNGGKESGLAEGFLPPTLKTIHTAADTAEKLDAAAMARITDAVVNLVTELDEGI